MAPMDDVLARKLSRQLRLLNSLIVFFSLVFLVLFAVAGVFAYRAITEIRDAKDSLTSLQDKAQQNLDFKSNLCSNSGQVSTLLKKQSDVCN
jgi:predicted PurR-regulated permease PerM